MIDCEILDAAIRPHGWRAYQGYGLTVALEDPDGFTVRVHPDEARRRLREAGVPCPDRTGAPAFGLSYGDWSRLQWAVSQGGGRTLRTGHDARSLPVGKQVALVVAVDDDDYGSTLSVTAWLVAAVNTTHSGGVPTGYARLAFGARPDWRPDPTPTLAHLFGL